MITAVLLISTAAISVFAIVKLLRRVMFESREQSRQFIREFQRSFPGRCIICSYHEYGVSHGHIGFGELVEAHVCSQKPQPQF